MQKLSIPPRERYTGNDGEKSVD